MKFILFDKKVNISLKLKSTRVQMKWQHSLSCMYTNKPLISIVTKVNYSCQLCSIKSIWTIRNICTWAFFSPWSLVLVWDESIWNGSISGCFAFKAYLFSLRLDCNFIVYRFNQFFLLISWFSAENFHFPQQITRANGKSKEMWKLQFLAWIQCPG